MFIEFLYDLWIFWMCVYSEEMQIYFMHMCDSCYHQFKSVVDPSIATALSQLPL